MKSVSDLFPPLLPGDILLYNGSGFVDWAIKFRTWSDVAHVEIYLDDGFSTASRFGSGVDIYPLRLDGLQYVRRPVIHFDLAAARKFASLMHGMSYGYTDLGRFYLLNLPTGGLICSQYGDLLLRAAGVMAFAEDYPAGTVSPRDFRVTSLAKTVWHRPCKSV